MTKRAGNVLVTNRTKMIVQTIVNQVKVDFVDYSRYAWIDEPVQGDGFFLASDKDIAAMKVNAIIGRGTRKDFIDLYVLLDAEMQDMPKMFIDTPWETMKSTIIQAVKAYQQ